MNFAFHPIRVARKAYFPCTITTVGVVRVRAGRMLWMRRAWNQISNDQNDSGRGNVHWLEGWSARIDPRARPSPRKSDDDRADECECVPLIGCPLIRRRSMAYESRWCKRARIREKFTVFGFRCDLIWPVGGCVFLRDRAWNFGNRPDSMEMISLSINKGQIRRVIVNCEILMRALARTLSVLRGLRVHAAFNLRKCQINL